MYIAIVFIALSLSFITPISRIANGILTFYYFKSIFLDEGKKKRDETVKRDLE